MIPLLVKRLVKPHWDLMDTPIDDIVSDVDVNGDKFETLGPYGVVDNPVIGPFSEFEPSTEASWDTTQQPAVPADGNQVNAYQVSGAEYEPLCRTTVIPDGKLTTCDAIMPPAEIFFVVTEGTSTLSQINKADIYHREGVVYTNPYYWQEIPSSPIIPPMYGPGPSGYEWDSWGTESQIDGSYRFWDELNLWDNDFAAAITIFDLNSRKTPDILKVYTDNHGETWARCTQKASHSSTIQAIASYPYLIGDHPAVVSNSVIDPVPESASLTKSANWWLIGGITTAGIDAAVLICLTATRRRRRA